MRTHVPKEDSIERKWHLVDAEGKILGRLATEIATILRGKDKPEFTPHLDVGDYVVVINAEKIELSGKKWDQKLHIYHTRYRGGFRQIPYRRLRKTNPEAVIKLAVKGMLPKNKLGRKLLKKLKVYPGPDHPHQGQNPEPLETN
jgi:large subunit ribosomal protein L13